MKRVIVIKRLSALFVALLLILSVVKVNTNVYVGDYAYSSRCIDILLKVDNEVILDGLLHNSPFFPTILKPKLRYGFHRINVISEIANINQETRVFLCPNQHINIEFLGADTLCAQMYKPLNKNILVGTDSIIQQLGTVEIAQCDTSVFLVESRFNPFYIE